MRNFPCPFDRQLKFQFDISTLSVLFTISFTLHSHFVLLIFDKLCSFSHTHTLAGQMTRRSSGDCSSAAQVQLEEQQEPVGDLQDLCAFCLYPKHDPVWLLCRHSFCRSCLHLYRQAIDWPAKSCPLCRRSLSEPPPPRRRRCCSGKKKQQLCLKHVSEVSQQFLTPLFTFPSTLSTGACCCCCCWRYSCSALARSFCS